MANITQLLAAIDQGQPQAAEQLLPLVYDELRRLARAKLAQEKPGQTLQATALVHEAYLRLVGRESGVGSSDDVSNPSPDPRLPTPAFASRGHFFASAAEAMRRILVEAARRKRRLKHGGDHERQPLEEDALALPEVDEDLIELDAAIDKLAQKDPRKAELVKLRYFAGLTQQQAAAALGIGVSTADRDWAYARAWLFREVSKGSQG
jgi:RNA polymerase sigma factor (sigma-70 family)